MSEKMNHDVDAVVPEDTDFDDIEVELQASSREASLSFFPAPGSALGAMGPARAGIPPLRRGAPGR